MDEDRHAREPVETVGSCGRRAVGGRGDPVLLRPRHALDDGVDRLEVRRVGGQRDGELLARAAVEHAPGALVVLHVTGALHRLGIEVALELLEDLAVGLAHDVGQHVEAAAVGHAHHDLGHPRTRGGIEQRVQQDDGRLRAFETEALLSDVARVEEALEDLGRVEPAEDVPLLLDVERRRLAFDVLLDPALLLGILNVHVLDGERPAVGIAQHVEDLVERGDIVPGQAVGHELARQVPDGEPVGQRVELGVDVRRLRVQRVEVGDEVAAHPVHVDERLHMHLLHEALVLSFVAAGAGIAVDLPADGLVRHAHRLEQRVVEPVGAREKSGHPAQEQAGLGALNDAMVVGGGDRHHLAEAQLGQHARVRRLEPGRIAERPDPDDGALAGHQARHGLHRAERSGVGQGHGRAGEVVGADFVGVDLADEVLVGQDEGAEVEGIGVLDARDEQRAAPVALLLVDGEAQPDVLVVDDARLSLAAAIGHEGRVQHGYVVQGADDRVPDDVGEADLRPRGPGQLVVQDQAVDLEEAGRHRPHAGRRGHGQAGFHVGHDARGRTAQRGGLLGPRLTDWCRSRGSGHRNGRPGRGLVRQRPVQVSVVVARGPGRAGSRRRTPASCR